MDSKRHVSEVYMVREREPCCRCGSGGAQQPICQVFTAWTGGLLLIYHYINFYILLLHQSRQLVVEIKQDPPLNRCDRGDSITHEINEGIGMTSVDFIVHLYMTIYFNHCLTNG